MQRRADAPLVAQESIGDQEPNGDMVGALASAVNCAYLYLKPTHGRSQGRGDENRMRLGYQVAYSHYQDDLETGEVEAETHEECHAKVDAAVVALTYQMARELPVVASIETWEIPERRFRLDLTSDREDLDLAEVAQ